MTVIFMEHCFQILEKNKILGLKNSMLVGWPARSVATVEKRSLFLVCKVYWLLLYKIWPTRNFQLFKFFPFWKKFSAFPEFGNFGHLNKN